MPARTRKIRHDEETRVKIQTSQLINRLTSHVLGTVEMQGSQVTAALGLLKKSLPDLAAVEHTGKDGGPISLSIESLLQRVADKREAIHGRALEPKMIEHKED